MLGLGLLTLAACGTPCSQVGDDLQFSPDGGAVEADGLRIEVEASEELPEGFQLIVTADGELVEGVTAVHGVSADFRPREPYADGQELRVVAEWTCGDDTVQVQGRPLLTDALGSPVQDVAGLVGRTYASEGTTFRVVEPAGDLGALLEETLHMVWLPLLHVDEIVSGTPHLSLYWADPFEPDVPTQRPCSLPQSLGAASFDNPYLQTPATDVEVITGFGSARVYDVEVVGTLSADGGRLGDVSFTGLFDIRDLVEELGYGNEIDSFCADAFTLGHRCVPCPDSAMACLPIGIDGVEAQAQEIDLRDSDVCRIADSMVLWNTDHLYRATSGGDEVTRVNYNGIEVWTAAFDQTIAFMSASPDREHVMRLVVNDGDGHMWMDIDPATGSVLEQGVFGRRTDLPALAWIMGEVVRGGCGATASTVPMQPGHGLPALLGLALVFLRRARRDGGSS